MSSTHLSQFSPSPSPSNSPSYSHPPPPPNHTNIIIIIAVLVSFLFLLVTAAILLLIHLRKRQRQRQRQRQHQHQHQRHSLSENRPHPTHSSTDLFSTDPDPFASTTNLTRPFSTYNNNTGTSIIDPSHPAARITPFGSPASETPRFKRTYGSPMRIAQRLPSGAWHFVDPSPANTDITIDGASRHPGARSRKEWEAQAHTRGHGQAHSVRSSGSTWDKSRRSSDITLPPPAYTPSRESVSMPVPVSVSGVKLEEEEEEEVYEMKDVGPGVDPGCVSVSVDVSGHAVVGEGDVPLGVLRDTEREFAYVHPGAEP